MAHTFALRAISSDSLREVVSAEPLTITLDDADYRLAPLVLPAARELLGAAVVLLGADGQGVVEVEVLGTGLAPGLTWEPLSVDRSGREPWAQPGWYVETCTILDEALAGLGRTRTGPVVQERTWSIAALMRVPTDAGELWFKQVPDLFAVEGPLTAWLGVRLPALVPRVAHLGPGWWLTEAMPPPVREFAGMQPFAALGRLQRATVDCVDELLAVGCQDRRLPTLLPALDALVGRVPLRDEQWAALAAGRPQLASAVDRLIALGLPDTLVHGDFHGGNVTGTEDGWIIYDWTDGCVSHPLLDAQPLAMTRKWTDEVLDEGLAHWWPGVALTAKDWAAVRTVGMAHQVVSYLQIAAAIGSAGEGEWAAETRRFADELLALLPAD